MIRLFTLIFWMEYKMTWSSEVACTIQNRHLDIHQGKNQCDHLPLVNQKQTTCDLTQYCHCIRHDGGRRVVE